MCVVDDVLTSWWEAHVCRHYICSYSGCQPLLVPPAYIGWPTWWSLILIDVSLLLEKWLCYARCSQHWGITLIWLWSMWRRVWGFLQTKWKRWKNLVNGWHWVYIHAVHHVKPTYKKAKKIGHPYISIHAKEENGRHEGLATVWGSLKQWIKLKIAQIC